MASQTPNLDLLKKDPVIDGNDTFNIETMLNENWDKIDIAFGDVWRDIEELDIETSDIIDGNRSEVAASEKAVGDLNRNISARLDVLDTSEVTLNPGMQVIEAERSSTFNLGNVQGKTRINLAGNASTWVGRDPHYPATSPVTLSFEYNVLGRERVTKAQSTYTEQQLSAFLPFIRTPSSTYVIAIDVYPTKSNTFPALAVRVNRSSPPSVYGVAGSAAPINTWSTVFAVLKPTDLTGESDLLINPIAALTGQAGREGYDSGEFAYFSNVRVYEITPSEAATINANNTPEYLKAGIRGVDGLYAINHGENLLPPFYEASVMLPTHTVTAPYRVHVETYTDNPSLYSQVPFKVAPNTEYSISVEGNNVYYSVFPNDLMEPRPPLGWDNAPTATFNSGNNRELLFLFRNLDFGLSADIENVMIVLGTEARPFKPQKKSMLAFQTELHAHPVDGSNPDILFKQGKEYKKLEKWGKETLDTLSGWVIAQNNPGFKVFTLPLLSSVPYSQFLLKYDGSKVPSTVAGIWTGGDQVLIADNRYLYLSISNADSGWGERNEVTEFPGDGTTVKFTIPTALIPPNFQLMSQTITARVDSTNIAVTAVNGFEITVATAPAAGKSLVVNFKIGYAPTHDEIKAFIYGWRMAANENWGLPYTGSGRKAWGRITGANGLVEGSGILETPTTLNTEGGYKPYELLYLKASPTIENVEHEGALMLHEGKNLIEVGSGIVLRERAKPYYNAGIPGAGINAPTSVNYPGSGLLFKLEKFIAIYRNDDTDIQWKVKDGGGTTGGGNQYADMHGRYYDNTAVYSVTYTKLDKSLIAPIAGEAAANENAQISDLVEGVTEVLHRMSIAEMKKADKDAPKPQWLVPTLLNGWVAQSALGYMLRDGYVYFRGAVNSGIVGSDSPILILPVGYRPLTSERVFSVVCRNGASTLTNARVRINPDGRVMCDIGSNVYIGLDDVHFLAEQ